MEHGEGPWDLVMVWMRGVQMGFSQIQTVRWELMCKGFIPEVLPGDLGGTQEGAIPGVLS